MRGVIIAVFISLISAPGAIMPAQAHDVKAEVRHHRAADAHDRAKTPPQGKSAGAPAAKCRNRPEDFQARRELGVFHDQLEQEDNLRDRLNDECPANMAGE